MGERGNIDDRDIRLPSAEEVAWARERERKMQLLERLSDALGRPVADFYETGNRSEAPAGEAEGNK